MSILYRDSAEYGAADDHQMRAFLIRAAGGRMGFVLIAPENTGAAHRHRPVFRNHQFDPAEDRVGLDDDLVLLGVGLPQIDLNAAEYRRQVTALELLRLNAPVDAAEYGCFIER